MSMTVRLAGLAAAAVVAGVMSTGTQALAATTGAAAHGVSVGVRNQVPLDRGRHHDRHGHGRHGRWAHGGEGGRDGDGWGRWDGDRWDGDDWWW